jgi:hypothetical protein
MSSSLEGGYIVGVAEDVLNVGVGVLKGDLYTDIVLFFAHINGPSVKRVSIFVEELDEGD